MSTHRKIRIAATVLVFVSVSAASVRAADSSPWTQDLHSAFRLLAGASGKNAASLRAGVEVRMDSGWHTYWRYAGDSGVPPRFDFSGSTNLASAIVRYPAPLLFTDETGNTLGYKDNVIFPIEVRAKNPLEPVTLHVKLDYAVCEKLCVPAEGRAEIALAPGAQAENDALKAAEARVPQPVPPAKFDLSVKRVNGAAKPIVALDLKPPAGKPLHIFVEGPTPEWALPIPQQVPGVSQGRQHFRFDLDGLPPGVDSGKGPFDLTFTIVAGERAYEVKTHLD
jgi:DsbC/DsbD-like thiol-disulfide interchange protein